MGLIDSSSLCAQPHNSSQNPSISFIIQKFNESAPVAITVLAHNVFSTLTGSSPSLSTF